MHLAIAIGLSLLGGFGGLAVAASLLAFPSSVRNRLVPWLVSYAVGALLGVALLDLMPQALAALSPRQAFGALLAGILTFFVLEKLAVWRHCHTHECDVHRSSAPLVLIGDAAHNFMDGAVIGAAVVTSLPLAINSAIAVLAHEIPHEVGDFAILLHAGYSKTRALMFNALAEAAGVAGAITAFVFLDRIPSIGPYFLAFATASFVYVAMSDLIPDLHRGTFDDSPVRQVLLVSAGIGTVLLL
ncbi:MAG: ZIP family metal transporter [Acidobacteria bacterium]|nr:ZIP family metal transporter [Acidobacteriota bacterium]